MTFQGRANRAEMLPIEPFRQWLIRLVDRFGGADAIEPIVDLPARTIRRFINSNETPQTEVSLDIVDHAVTHEGNTQLWDVYPSLYNNYFE